MAPKDYKQNVVTFVSSIIFSSKTLTFDVNF